MAKKGVIMRQIKDLILTTKYELDAINYLKNTKIGIRISGIIMEILYVPDKYYWRHIIKNKRSARISIYTLLGLQAVAVLGVEFGLGLLAKNPDMLFNGLYAHLGLDVVMVTLAPSWGRFVPLRKEKSPVNASN